MSERSQFALLAERRFVPFRRIRLAVGVSVQAAQATPETLQADVLALRGDRR